MPCLYQGTCSKNHIKVQDVAGSQMPWTGHLDARGFLKTKNIEFRLSNNAGNVLAQKKTDNEI